MGTTQDGFTLADLIKHTASELKEAQNENPDEGMLQLKSCEMELAVTVGGGGEAGFRLWFANASANVNQETVSKVKLVFSPLEDIDMVYKVERG